MQYFVMIGFPLLHLTYIIKPDMWIASWIVSISLYFTNTVYEVIEAAYVIYDAK